jgi:hypothetical protein
VNLAWDYFDDRMLSCECVRSRSTTNTVKKVNTNAITHSEFGNNNANSSEDESEVEVFIFFASSDHEILMQDSYATKNPFGSFIGFHVPKLYYRNAVVHYDDGNTIADVEVQVMTKTMRDFIGMNKIDEKMKTGLLDFGFNLALGM